MASASRSAYSRPVAGVYGKNPDLFADRMGPQSQYERGRLAECQAASAFSLIALNPRPGGIIRPFCDPAIVTSTPHSSCRNSMQPIAETESTMNRAGWFAASIASRTRAMLLVTPVEVSLCTTMTARIWWSGSARSRSSIASASTPLRQSPAITSTCSPMRVASRSHRAAKCPVS